MNYTLKEKLKKRELTIGSWLTIDNEMTTEIMAKSGYDWLTIDMEHSPIELGMAQKMIRIIDLCNCSPLVRVGCNDPNLIKRVMDAGAVGVIVPMVNTKKDAEQAVNSVKYPPVGFRGVGLARAQKYGLDFAGYKKWCDENSVTIVQIEHIDAVNNLRDILSTEGVDGFIVGPYDLSASLGFPGEFEHPLVKEALAEVKKVSAELNALSGFHVIPPCVDAFNEKVQEGYKFVAHSLDSLILAQNVKNLMGQIKNER